MDSQRKDAARNRLRILDAARDARARGDGLALNAVARAADVGVATVYRHFPSVEALEEVLVWDHFAELRVMLASADFDHLLNRYFSLLVSDPLFEKVTSRPRPVLEHTTFLRNNLIEALSELLHREKDLGRLRADLDTAALLALLCGLAHSARTLQVSADSGRGRGLFDILLSGLRAPLTAAAR